jgi:hypothetical protein
VKKRTAIAILALFEGSGCAVFIPTIRDPRAEAAENEKKACPSDVGHPEGLFDPASVVSVEPIYSTMRSGRSGYATNIVGAKLSLRPLPGVTREEIERALVCHNARRELGRKDEPEIVDDPYWVPGKAIEISVELERGAMSVEVKGATFETSQEILRRANAFRRTGG